MLIVSFPAFFIAFFKQASHRKVFSFLSNKIVHFQMQIFLCKKKILTLSIWAKIYLVEGRGKVSSNFFAAEPKCSSQQRRGFSTNFPPQGWLFSLLHRTYIKYLGIVSNTWYSLPKNTDTSSSKALVHHHTCKCDWILSRCVTWKWLWLILPQHSRGLRKGARHDVHLPSLLVSGFPG